MKKSLIWITAGVAAVGFAIPAFAAHGDSPRDIVPTHETAARATPATPATVVDDNATRNSVDDNATRNSVEDNATRNSVEDNATRNSVEDNATRNSVEDNATTNSVEDVSGPCDEAEHANDPRCTGVTVTSTDDNSTDDSGHHSGSDDSGHHGGSDDSGHHGGNHG